MQREAFENEFIGHFGAELLFEVLSCHLKSVGHTLIFFTSETRMTKLIELLGGLEIIMQRRRYKNTYPICVNPLLLEFA